MLSDHIFDHNKVSQTYMFLHSQATLPTLSGSFGLSWEVGHVGGLCVCVDVCRPLRSGRSSGTGSFTGKRAESLINRVVLCAVRSKL